jgi:tetratricopeptide (TPR) repeat protein
MKARYLPVAVLGLLWTFPAAADDMKDCQSGEPGRALAACTRIAEAPSSPPRAKASALSLRAMAHQRQGAFDKALDDFDQAIVHMEGAGIGGWEFSFAHYLRAGTHRIKGDLDRAIADYSQSIRIAPGWDKSYSERSAIYFQKGDLENALADITKVISFRPSHPFVANAYAMRAMVHHRMGQMPASLADADKSLELKPGSAVAHYMRGKALEAQGRIDDAAAALRTAREIDANVDAMLKDMLTPPKR